LVHSGFLIRSIAGRRETRTGYLFDGQLILVKPDNLRKNQSFYRERIDLYYCHPRIHGHCKFTQILQKSSKIYRKTY